MQAFPPCLSVREARLWLIRSIKAAGQAEAERKAQLSLAHLLHREPAQLPLYLEQILTAEESQQLQQQLTRLLAGEPLQYILGETGFMGLTIQVGPGVLIPRPDTEIMAEQALALLADHPTPVIADICTGSGALAVSLAYYLPQATVYGTDISPPALHYAHQNAVNLGVAERCFFHQGDLLQPLQQEHLYFDLIVSNPPYLTAAEMTELPPDVRQEPRQALAGGGDGLDFYRRLATEAAPLLKPTGSLLLEHGLDQQEAVADILSITGWQIMERLVDLAGRPRCIWACRQSAS